MMLLSLSVPRMISDVASFAAIGTIVLGLYVFEHEHMSEGHLTIFSMASVVLCAVLTVAFVVITYEFDYY